MKLGDRGTHVVKVQNALNLKGASPKLVADGIFGNGTLTAVKAFQTKVALPVTGIVDNAMAVKLGLFPSDIVAPANAPITQTVATTSSTYVSTGISPLEKFYTVMGGKTMAMVGVGVLALGVAISYFSTNKTPAKAQEKK